MLQPKVLFNISHGVNTAEDSDSAWEDARNRGDLGLATISDDRSHFAV
jgi:hypothetical protein